MNKDSAIEILELPVSYDSEQLEVAFKEKSNKLTARLNDAPEALVSKFKDNLSQVETAYKVLKNVLDNEQSLNINDLPVSEQHINETYSSPLLSEIYSQYEIKETSTELNNLTLFKAVHKQTNKNVEITFIDKTLSPNLINKIEQRIQFLLSIHSDQIQRVIDHSISDVGGWIAFEQIEATAITKFLNKSKPKLIFRLMKEAQQELSYAFRDYAHSNLTSSSVSITADENIYIRHPQIEDFLLSSVNENHYEAPEMRRSGHGTQKTDVYSLAVITLELLLGHKLTTATLQSSITDSSLPGNASQCFQKALHTNPTKRYKEFHDFIADLEKCYTKSSKNILAKPLFMIPAVLILLLVIFNQSIFNFYNKTKTSIVENTVDNKRIVIRYLAESKDLLNQLNVFSTELKRNKEKAESILDRAERSTRYSAQEKRDARLDVTLISEQNDIFNQDIMPGSVLLESNSSLVVASDLASSNEHDEALLILDPLRKMLLQAKSASDSLEMFSKLKLQRAAKKQLLSAHIASLPAEDDFIKQEKLLLDKESKNAQSKDIALIVNEIYKPLIELYDNELEALKQQKIASKEKFLRSFIDSINSNLVAIPAGSFSMGITKAGSVDTRPVHKVSINSFQMSKYPVANTIWHRYVKISGHYPSAGSTDNNMPATNITWNQTQKFIAWLSKITGQSFRLATEAEWEYASRAAKKTYYSWGNGVGKNNANCAKCGSKWDNQGTSPVGSFSANAFGIYDMSGNVWEWTQDCYVKNYRGAPSNGQARKIKDCERRVLRGGAWNSNANEIMPTYRNAAQPLHLSSTIGFRLVKD